MTINNFVIVGRAGGEPQRTTFESGSVKVEFSVAVDRIPKSDKPDWYRIELWGKQAEVAQHYVTKGKFVEVTGELGFNEYTDRNNVKRFKYFLKGVNIQLLGGSAPQGSNSSTQSTNNDNEYDF